MAENRLLRFARERGIIGQKVVETLRENERPPNEEKMKEKLTGGVKTECKDRDQLSMDGFTPEILEHVNPAIRILVNFMRAEMSGWRTVFFFPELGSKRRPWI